MMMKLISRFQRDESGAVTVDWVVLSAAVIGMGMLVLTPIAFTADSNASDIADNIATYEVGYQSQN